MLAGNSTMTVINQQDLGRPMVNILIVLLSFFLTLNAHHICLSVHPLFVILPLRSRSQEKVGKSVIWKITQYQDTESFIHDTKVV